jgi:predicted small lipoprotein YifL
MVPPKLGDVGVTRMLGSGKLALVGLALMALALSGCGRKSGLDLPPQAATQQPAANQQAEPRAPGIASPLSVFDTEDEEKPAPVRGQKRRIFLDPILD